MARTTRVCLSSFFLSFLFLRFLRMCFFMLLYASLRHDFLETEFFECDLEIGGTRRRIHRAIMLTYSATLELVSSVVF